MPTTSPPEKTLAATKLVTKGKAYRLGIEVNSKTPAYPPRYFTVTVVQPGQTNGATLGPNKLTYNDDIIAGWNGVGPQIDGFGHIGIDGIYYNCNKGDIGKITGLTKLGIENVPAIATRGIVLDMAGTDGRGHRQGRHGVQPRRDRGRHEAPGREEHRQG